MGSGTGPDEPSLDLLLLDILLSLQCSPQDFWKARGYSLQALSQGLSPLPEREMRRDPGNEVYSEFDFHKNLPVA